MIKLSILTIALFASISVQAAYVIKIPMDKEAVSFKQYYDNVGVDPNENNNSATDPSCEIKNGDFAPFSGQLLKVSKKKISNVLLISLCRNLFLILNVIRII